MIKKNLAKTIGFVICSLLISGCKSAGDSTSSTPQLDSPVTEKGKMVPFDVTNPWTPSSNVTPHEALNHFVQFCFRPGDEFINEKTFVFAMPEKDATHNPNGTIRELWLHDISYDSVSEGAGHATFEWEGNSTASIQVSLKKDDKYALWSSDSPIPNGLVIHNYNPQKVLTQSQNCYLTFNGDNYYFMTYLYSEVGNGNLYHI